MSAYNDIASTVIVNQVCYKWNTFCTQQLHCISTAEAEKLKPVRFAINDTGSRSACIGYGVHITVNQHGRKTMPFGRRISTTCCTITGATSNNFITNTFSGVTYLNMTLISSPE